MRTIVAGSRNNVVYEDLLNAVHSLSWTPTVVISGTARGADKFGEQWATSMGIPIERFPADWTKHGKPAGHIRNSEMADNAEALLALWDGQSRGTKGMIDIARRKGLKILIWDITDESNLFS